MCPVTNKTLYNVYYTDVVSFHGYEFADPSLQLAIL